MVGLGPVEAAAARDEDVLLVQQVEGELLVISNVELLHVDPGEDVERGLGLHGRDAVDVVERLVDEVALLVDAPAGLHVALHALVAAERRLDDGLRRHVGAQAHVGEHVDAIDEVAHAALVAREDHPADAVARHHMGLGEAGERDARQVGRQRGNGDVLEAVHAQAVVDLVREDHQLVPAGDLHDLLEHLARVDGARGVVGVDDHERLGVARDLSLHVGEVGRPLGLLVAQVVHGRAARERGAGGPQRVVGARDEDLVTGVEQHVHAELDELGDAVAGVDPVHAHVGQVLELRVLHDRLAGREEAARVGVALAFGQLLTHVVDNLVGRAEAKRRGVADVEFEDAQALVLHAGRLVGDGAADVVEDVLAHGGTPFAGVGGDGLGRGLRPRGSSGPLPRGKPTRIHAEKRSKQGHHVRTRHDLAARILADLALPELLATCRRLADEVRLLEALLGHRLAKTLCEGLVRHLVSRSSI